MVSFSGVVCTSSCGQTARVNRTVDIGLSEVLRTVGHFFNSRLHQTAAITAGFRSAICQSTARELRKPGLPAVDCGRLPWHLKYDRLMRQAGRSPGRFRSSRPDTDRRCLEMPSNRMTCYKWGARSFMNYVCTGALARFQKSGLNSPSTA
jgi:hypothetical protein